MTQKLRDIVLIESDWNLNVRRNAEASGRRQSINRIRLEFKFDTVFNKSFVAFLVLIESDWNLNHTLFS